jgi:hypothetical protein
MDQSESGKTGRENGLGASRDTSGSTSSQSVILRGATIQRGYPAISSGDGATDMGSEHLMISRCLKGESGRAAGSCSESADLVPLRVARCMALESPGAMAPRGQK